MDEIDEGATLRKIEEAAAQGIQELEDRVELAGEIDGSVAERSAEQQEQFAEATAAGERSLAATREQAKEETQPPPGWSAPAKPTTLSFTNEDDEPGYRPAPPVPVSGGFVPPAAPPAPVEPPAPAPSAAKYLSFGIEEDEAAPGSAPAPRPAPTRAQRRAAAAAAEPEDDDWSGHSWIKPS
ncbi:hypothetical protein [Alloactinosynnema sp. L-07]|nr:hypothetical protein [Alloactinosynnema sp. L-07]